MNGGSLVPGPETDTDATGAVPAATAEVTGGGPETGVQNTNLLEIDLQEKSHETERGKRRALLRGGMRAQMANLVPRDQKREKLARSELK